MFIDVEEIEENIQACGKLHNQTLDEDVDVEELEKEYEQCTSYLGFHSSTYDDTLFHISIVIQNL